jgi:hypothetical protein
MRLNPCVTALAACWLMMADVTAATSSDPAQLNRVVVAASKAQVSPWFRAESQRFIVYSDTSAEDVTQLLDNLEKLDHLLRLYTLPARTDEQRQPKLTLYYQRGAAAFAEIAADRPDAAVGLYSSCASGVQGFNVHLERVPSLRDDQLDRAPLDKTLSYVFEGYARHFVYRHTDIRTPSSFVHGLAQYFSTARFSDKQMVVGRMPPALAGYLNFLDDGQGSALAYDDVLRQNLSAGHSVGGAAAVRLEFEAKTWLLTHYMLSSDDRRRRMNRYLALASDGIAAPAAFETAFGITMAELPRLIGRYSRQQVQAMRVDLPSLPTALVRFKALPRAAGEFVLADAALKSCPGPQAGAELLQKITALAAQFPADEFARLTLSRAQIDWGDPQATLPRLEALLQDDETNIEARALLGKAHLRLAGRSEGEARRTHLQAARRHLQLAAASNPPAPDVALALLQADVATTDEPASTTLDGVVTAWRAAREVDALTRSAALAYAYSGKGDEAYAALASLAQPARNDPMARWARQWQGRLEAGVRRSDILAEMRAAAPADTPFKEWTLEKDNVPREISTILALEDVAKDAPLELAMRLYAEAGMRRAKLNSGRSLVPIDGR